MIYRRPAREPRSRWASLALGRPMLQVDADKY